MVCVCEVPNRDIDSAVQGTSASNIPIARLFIYSLFEVILCNETSLIKSAESPVKNDPFSINICLPAIFVQPIGAHAIR